MLHFFAIMVALFQGAAPSTTHAVNTTVAHASDFSGAPSAVHTSDFSGAPSAVHTSDFSGAPSSSPNLIQQLVQDFSGSPS
jgi:hypothetical protein